MVNHKAPNRCFPWWHGGFKLGGQKAVVNNRKVSWANHMSDAFQFGIQVFTPDGPCWWRNMHGQDTPYPHSFLSSGEYSAARSLTLGWGGEKPSRVRITRLKDDSTVTTLLGNPRGNPLIDLLNVFRLFILSLSVGTGNYSGYDVFKTDMGFHKRPFS